MLPKMRSGPFLKLIATSVLGFLGIVSTLLFEPNVFRGVTIPLVAKSLGWKARAESARLTPFGKLQIEGMEAVDPRKSRIDLDSALVLVDLQSLLTGKPEIVQAELKFGLIDFEVSESSESMSVPSIPFSLREATLEIQEGRVRKGAGAWIFGGVKGNAKGWDGRSPREIQIAIEKLSWSGLGKEEISGTIGFQVLKKTVGVGADQWDGKLTVDCKSVVDLSPLELVVPCRLVLEGRAIGSLGTDWKMERIHGSWEGIGGAKISALATGQWSKTGEWGVDLTLDPVDLALVGVLFQSRGVKSVIGNLGGDIHLEGGGSQGLVGRTKLQGQGVQIASGLGLLWPARPADFLGNGSGTWVEKSHALKIESFQVELGQKGGMPDLQAKLDRPAQFILQGGVPTSTDTATLQWIFQGVELAAVAPLLVAPAQFKVQGGQLSAKGEAKIQGGTVQVVGRAESRAIKAGGSWLQGEVQVDSVAAQFRGVFEGSSKVRLEEVSAQAAWPGGATEDFRAKVSAEWDWSKGAGWVMGDGEVSLAGLASAWSGAKLWPDSGLAKLHLEFSGNLQEQGRGLASVNLNNMHWAGETASPWKAKASTEVILQAGLWTLPEIMVQADRTGQVLLESQGALEWSPSRGEGRASLEFRRVESSCLVPILGLVTPHWKWQEASGSGSLQFERKGSQDRIQGKLDGSITVETGTPDHSRLVDFSKIQGQGQVTWPSSSSGQLSIQELSVQAQHRDGSDALRVSLDQPLSLQKIGNGEWRPSGQGVATGQVIYTGWPIGLFTPLVFPEAKETSLIGTASGFVKVRSDPQKGLLQGEVEVEMPDFTIDLPRVQLRDHQVSLKAGVTLSEKGDITVPKVSLTVQKSGKSWLNFTVVKEVRPALLADGTLDLAVFKDVVPGLSEFISAGDLALKAEVGEPKDGLRKIGYSTVIRGFSGGPAARGGIQGAEVKSQGIVQWKKGCQSIQDVELSAKSQQGNMSVTKLTWAREGAWAWEGGRIAEGWIAWMINPWIEPSRWVDGDAILGAGFWQPGEFGGSGEVDLSLVDARLVEDLKKSAVSARLSGNFDFDKRSKCLSFQDGLLTFSDYPNDPVGIPTLRLGNHSVAAQIKGGVFDLRGILAQTDVIRNAKPVAGASPASTEPWKVDLGVDLQNIIVEEAAVGPVRVPRFRWGPEGILLEPSTVEVKGGVVKASVTQPGGVNQPVDAKIVMSKFPLGAILGSVITDAKGPIGGWIDLQVSAQAAKPTLAEIRRTLSGRGTFRLYQAHLERLPSLAKALQSAGAILGSSFIAGSEINDLGSQFTLQGEVISVPDLKVTGSALMADLNGWLNWWAQTIDFKLRFALTKEAMQSSGQLQGVMTQLIGSSGDYYTKIPGEARISGPLADPQVNMDVGKMLAEGGINLLLNAPVGILQGAGGAAGGAAGAVTQPAGSILQGVGNLFKGF